MQNALRSVTIPRRLRKSMTPSEIALWNALRRKQQDGLRFRRQHPLGPYVLDFFCPARRLAVEVDGGVHTDERGEDRDAVRDRWIEDHGIRVLRISDRLVLEDMDSALRLINEAAGAAGRS